MSKESMKQDVESRIKDLRKQIDYHNYRYYVLILPRSLTLPMISSCAS